MPLVKAQCTNCGANLEVDNTKDASVCPYCGSAYIVEKAIKHYNTTNHITANVVNVYGGNSADFVIRAGKLEKYNGAATEVVIPNSVTIIGYQVFRDCTGLTSVTIPDSVTSIGSEAFCGCTGLTSVTIPNSVTSIGGLAFYGCTGLTSVTIPDNVTSIEGYAFYGCTGLTSVTIPNSVTKIGVDAFGHCTSLREVTILGSPETWSGCFSDCDKLTTINASKYWKRKNWTVAACLASYRPNYIDIGCYVATCVYGSYDCPPVWTLRRFRDGTLALTWYGRAFIRCYYAVSPTLVRWFGGTHWFRAVWKKRLDRLVSRLNEAGTENTPYRDRQW